MSLGLSLVVAASASYLTIYLFEGLSYAPLSAALLTAAAVFLHRSRSLRRRLPEPYGEGREETIGAREMTRTGLLLVLGGIVFVVLPLSTVFFLPILFFILYLAFALGLALAEILQFAWISRLEARAGAQVCSVTEETELGGRGAMIKRTVLVPVDRPE